MEYNKKPITITQFIKNFPREKCFYNTVQDKPAFVNFDYNSNLKYEQKMQYLGKNRITTRLSATDHCIYYIQEHKTIVRVGKSIFPQLLFKQSIYINKSEIGISKGVTADFIFSFFKLLGIDWFKDINENNIHWVVKNKTIFKRIITNRIYNEETLYKSIGSSVLKLKNIPWKVIRNYYNNYKCNYHISLTDLYWFTKNIEQSVEVLVKAPIDKQHLYYDLIVDATKLNQIVDLKWSDKRINDEHKKQVQQLMEREIDNKEEIPIYDVSPDLFPIKLLNTEKEIFIEGKVMHHCLYTNYYNRIKHHSYIAFHINHPEECTLGIHMIDGKAKLNQIYKKYDVPVNKETRDLAEKFIFTYQDELVELFNQQKEVKEEDNLVQRIFDDRAPINFQFNLPW